MYAGGTIKKTLLITCDNQVLQTTGNEVEIDEYYSADRTITYPETECPAGYGCPAQRIYFDIATRTWMKEYPNGDNNALSPGSKVAANVSNNTMGGLHLFDGLARYDFTGIIPLSAHNFLVVSDFGESVSQSPLIQTIVATDPSVATPVSATEQTQVIHKEGLLYGAAGTSIDIGTWYKDGQNIYDSQGDIVQGANAATFMPINTYSDGYVTTESGFATDGLHVFSSWNGVGTILQSADPATFVMIREAYQIPYSPTSGKNGQSFTGYDTTYEKDKSHVWDEGKPVPGADPNTFVVTGDTMPLNASGDLTLAHDANHSYGEDIKGNITVDGVAVQQ